MRPKRHRKSGAFLRLYQERVPLIVVKQDAVF